MIDDNRILIVGADGADLLPGGLDECVVHLGQHLGSRQPRRGGAVVAVAGRLNGLHHQPLLPGDERLLHLDDDRVARRDAGEAQPGTVGARRQRAVGGGRVGMEIELRRHQNILPAAAVAAVEGSRAEAAPAEALELVALPERLAAAARALREDEDRLVGLDCSDALRSGADRWAPPPPVAGLMRWLIDAALAPPALGRWQSALARQLLFIRSHWVRMPPLMLVRHLAHPHRLGAAGADWARRRAGRTPSGCPRRRGWRSRPRSRRARSRCRRGPGR